jgi:DnaJ-class molecular chaperone
MAQRQAFEILGLGQYAKEKEVQQRYRELALQYHPDKCRANCEEAAIKIVEINKAYELLQKKFA